MTIQLKEEGERFRLYQATTEEDARAFAEMVGAQSLTISGENIEILVLKFGTY
jgi:hypothetical protein